jgi:hypothetical protein
MLEITIAILGLLTVVVGAVVKFYKPKREPTLLDRLADVDRELAEQDAAAVNARVESRLRLLNPKGGGDSFRPPGAAGERRESLPPAGQWVVRAPGADAGNAPRAGAKG